MYAMGFGYYFGALLPFPLPETALKGLGLIIIAVLTLLNCRGTKGGDRIQKILTWGNLLVLMARAGYDPREAIPFWERMSKQAGKSSPPEFLSTHPATETRIADLKKYIPEAMPYYRAPSKS